VIAVASPPSLTAISAPDGVALRTRVSSPRTTLRLRMSSVGEVKMIIVLFWGAGSLVLAKISSSLQMGLVVAPESDLWETVRMAISRRHLQFANIVMGQPLSAQCSACKRVFIAKPKATAATDSLALGIKVEFDQHNCKEDASQAAARM
jgi:hypothetical protein